MGPPLFSFGCAGFFIPRRNCLLPIGAGFGTLEWKNNPEEPMPVKTDADADGRVCARDLFRRD